MCVCACACLDIRGHTHTQRLMAFMAVAEHLGNYLPGQAEEHHQVPFRQVRGYRAARLQDCKATQGCQAHAGLDSEVFRCQRIICGGCCYWYLQNYLCTHLSDLRMSFKFVYKGRKPTTLKITCLCILPEDAFPLF